MSWHAVARGHAQRAGFDPRYVRRLRWITKARAVRGVHAPLRANLRFVLLDPEPANFTYGLANQPALADWVAEVTGAEASLARQLLDELEADAELTARLLRATAKRWLWSKRLPPFGKRAGWYAIARIVKPELIVETGVHDGLASLLLLRALERNRSEGAPGRLVSFDVNPAAGWLVGEHPLWELRIEPSRAGLEQVLANGPPLGMFIHDSLHTYENEHFELSMAARHLAPRGVLISDNAHGTTALADVCAESGLSCALFHERPRAHFYPGGVVGAGWRAG